MNTSALSPPGTIPGASDTAALDDPHACPPGFRAGRVKDNFNPISKDYFRALGMAMLSSAERFVMDRALDLGWFSSAAKSKGFEGAAYPVAFDADELAAEADASRSTIYRAVASLVAKGLLARSEGGTYAIPKDYHGWTREDGATPLLSPARLAIARAAANPPKETHQRPQVAKTGQASPKNATTCRKNENPSPENATESRENGTPHIEERGRVPERIENRENTQEVGRVASPPTIPMPEPDRAPNVLSAAERAERDAAMAECDRLFPMLEDIKRAVSERRGGYAAAWYRPALAEMAKQPRAKHTARYLLGILGRFEQTGGPAASRPMANGAAPGGYVPSTMPILTAKYGINERRLAAARAKGIA